MTDTVEQLENVIDLGYNQEQTKEPFTMCFAYPKSGPILIKGPLDAVKQYMEDNLEGIYHYRLAHWRRGRVRGRWHIQNPNDDSLSFKESKKGGTKKYNLMFKNFGIDKLVTSFEKMPHDYIEDFDLFQVGI